MDRKFQNSKQAQSANIRIDTKKCTACWKCFDICPNNVIGRINLPWHKHTKIINEENCKGCQKCVKVCEFNAVQYFHNAER